MDPLPSLDEWLTKADPEHRGDPLWRMTAYRRALHLLEIGWVDAVALDHHRITRPIGAQLYRALGSIAANIAEGYSRSSGADRVRIFEYGLGSTRESAVWYLAGRPVLGRALYEERIALLGDIRRLSLTTISAERARRLKRRVSE